MVLTFETLTKWVRHDLLAPSARAKPPPISKIMPHGNFLSTTLSNWAVLSSSLALVFIMVYYIPAAERPPNLEQSCLYMQYLCMCMTLPQTHAWYGMVLQIISEWFFKFQGPGQFCEVYWGPLDAILPTDIFLKSSQAIKLLYLHSNSVAPDGLLYGSEMRNVNAILKTLVYVIHIG